MVCPVLTFGFFKSNVYRLKSVLGFGSKAALVKALKDCRQGLKFEIFSACHKLTHDIFGLCLQLQVFNQVFEFNFLFFRIFIFCLFIFLSITATVLPGVLVAYGRQKVPNFKNILQKIYMESTTLAINLQDW